MRVVVFSTLIVAACAGCSGAATDQIPAGEESPSPPPAVQRVVAELAAGLEVAPAELQVAASEEVVWSSAALGCPEPGKLYAQATTPGWRITVTGPGDASRQVHATADGSHWVVCERGRRVKPCGP